MRARPPAWAPPLIAGLALLLIFAGGLALSGRGAEELARTGVRTTGEVVEVHAGGRFPGSAEIRYRVAGVPRTGTLVVDVAHPAYRAGDRVTVLHDRDDPDRFRTPEVSNEPFWTLSLLGVPLLGGSFLLVRGIAGFAGRRRGGRHRTNGGPRG
ncbi:DUF3592 domain-containing protein [Saccharothrix sp. HUAS TT1]|uniref:DUF3592 domain-containing protein n=1 Tax=unclassified Saccharothrix TaxID=2593673 RepID=UPI00345B95E5